MEEAQSGKEASKVGNDEVMGMVKRDKYEKARIRVVRSDGRKHLGGAQVSDLMIEVDCGAIHRVGEGGKAGLGLEGMTS